MRLEKRVSELEGRLGSAYPAVWHWIVPEIGQDEAASIAAYEATHGPIGERDGCIVWSIIE